MTKVFKVGQLVRFKFDALSDPFAVAIIFERTGYVYRVLLSSGDRELVHHDSMRSL